MATTRDLIQRMARELDLYRQLLRDDCTSTHPLADEARAYLAQPKPKGPTVMEIIDLADEIEAEELGQVDLVRRALARWGRPAQSEPEGPTDKDLIRRLLLLAGRAVREALDFEYGDPEDRYIWRELQELKQLVKEANGQA
jgi:hypothetical protein